MLNLYLNIDDDVTRILKKIRAIRGQDITLVLPKEALLFSDPKNLQLLKQETENMGKDVAILTMDSRGQAMGRRAGFEIKGFEALRRGGPSVDMVKKGERGKTLRPVQSRQVRPAAPAKVLRPIPEPIAEEPEEELELEQPEPEQIRPERKHHNLLPHAAKPAPKKFFTHKPVPEPVEEAAPEFVAPAAIPLESQFFPEPEPEPAQARSSRKRLKLNQAEQGGKEKSKLGPRLLKIGILAALIVLILLYTVVLPEADIIVYARTEPIVRDFQITIDKNAKEADSQQLVIPGKLYDQDQSLTKQYDAKGQVNVGTKAQGKVQIYNFGTKTLKLGADTTTLTAGTKVYHFKADVNGIKPTKYVAGTKDPQPSTLIPLVDIIADQAGEDSNLSGGTRFEIHNQVLGTQPTILWAKNIDPIQSGTSRLSTSITQSDLDSATKDLTDSIFRAAQDNLATTQGLELLKSGSTYQVKSSSFDKKVGDQSLNFTGQMSARIQALLFSSDDLQKMVEQRINLTLDAGRYLVSGSQEKITPDFKNYDLNSGTGVINVHFESLVAAKIDTAGISSNMNGKSATELKELLLSNPDIDGVDISFKPFWVKSVPRFSGRVYVTSQMHIAQ